ncbi:Ppx/GppA phosphatase family protein [Hyphomicrobium sp. CS1GBMeth3]|uniref:Ppx/GppA phosphatase family protein n=1 Tax=Hyphomicrobium sp. CS1GBMeth3 TaxID=1892845 RepID=UPI000AB2E4BA|nr:Ppx/GppA phosphatase family protein [Hyphomicrobium sp. CS1GBMeth3]
MSELTDDERSGAPAHDPQPASHAVGAAHASAARAFSRKEQGSGPRREAQAGAKPGQVYGALDLGTNNCRLLLARPSRRGFRVVDAFSRIIRLGEGVSQSGQLSDAAMRRTIDALRVCATKLARNDVVRARCVATEACRIATNGRDFLRRVEGEVGLKLEVLDRETEASLAVSGCASLIDYRADYVLVFDIGGGSSELIWLDLSREGKDSLDAAGERRSGVKPKVGAWTSLPVGVVTLAERFGGHDVSAECFEDMVAYVSSLVRPFEALHGFRNRANGGNLHLLGTSGTVTTVAGIHLGLKRYDRARVDGCWLSIQEIQKVTYELLACSYQERVAEPCIGQERADLVLAGCAILEAILRMWPAERLRVADRGLREGILATLMSEDGVYRVGRRRRRQRSS